MATVTRTDSAPSLNMRALLQRYGLLVSLLVLCAVLALADPNFLTPNNLLNILRQASVNAVISVGLMLVILTRGIDLSVGSMLALSAVVSAQLLKQESLSPVLAIGVAVLVGAGLGFINGALVTYLKIPPFIATLGMMTFARGTALQFTSGKPITGLGDLGEGFRFLGSGVVAGIPVPILLAGGVLLLTALFLAYVPFGRFIYALGDNDRTAFLSGLPVNRVLLFVYAMSGALSALAGVILVGRLNSAQPTAGVGYEFDAIAAVVVGGTSFNGGEGTVWGTLIGVLIIAVLSAGLNILGVSAFYQDIAKGAVIALALLLYRAIR